MASVNVNVIFKSDTAARYAAANRVLANGEPAYERDTKRLKIGDGVTRYNDLPYQSYDPVAIATLSEQAVAAATQALAARDEAVAAAGGGSPASETAPGVVELASPAEVIAGTDPVRVVTAAGLATRLASFTAAGDATTTTKGVLRLATSAEVATGTATDIAVTPAGLASRLAGFTGGSATAATEVDPGVVRKATTTEATAGTSTTPVLTPASGAALVANRIGALTKASVGLSAVDNTADIDKPVSTLQTAALGFKADKSVLGLDPAGTFDTVEARLADLESRILAGGTAGKNGLESIIFGADLPTEPVVTNAIYGHYVAPVDMELVNPAVAKLNGDPGSGDTVLDFEMAPTGIGGSFASLFTTGRPTIPATLKQGFSGGVDNERRALLPKGSATRMRVVSAPVGSGGALAARVPAVSGNGAVDPTGSLGVPLNTGLSSGDVWIPLLFLGSTAAVSSWGNFADLGAPFPFGTIDPNVGPFRVWGASKVAGATEVAGQAVTFPSTTAILCAIAAANAQLVTPATANFALNSTAAATATTPAGLTTPTDGCIVAQFVCQRWTSANAPSTTSVDGTPVSSAQAQTNRLTGTGGFQNVGIMVAQYSQANAGAITPRTFTWVNNARSVTGTLVLRPSAGAVPTGIEVEGWVRRL